MTYSGAMLSPNPGPIQRATIWSPNPIRHNGHSDDQTQRDPGSVQQGGLQRLDITTCIKSDHQREQEATELSAQLTLIISQPDGDRIDGDGLVPRYAPMIRLSIFVPT